MRRSRVQSFAVAIALACALTLLGGYLVPRLDGSLPFGDKSVVAAVQDGTPAASPATVDPAECRVAPRPIEDFVAVMGTPGAVESQLLGTPVATPVLPSGGVPADPATVNAVTATVRELAACINANDLRRVSALWTDELVGRFFGGLDERGVAALAATPTPLAADLRAPTVAVRDVRVLPDGRVVATVGDARFVFVKVGGRYLFADSSKLWRTGTPTP
jgi:ketosteroid isomerase-like protein